MGKPKPAKRVPRQEEQARTALNLWRLHQIAPAKSPPMQAYDVAASHSRWSLQVSDVGGSRKSYRNGRASAVAEGTPFPKGPPESSVGGTPG
jgi:hypothetical protein